MRTQLQRRGPRPDPGLVQSTASPAAADRPDAFIRPVPPAGRSCCCPAAPAYQVVLPHHPVALLPTEILLCGHHYRAHEAHLKARHAAVYDRTGWRIEPPA